MRRRRKSRKRNAVTRAVAKDMLVDVSGRSRIEIIQAEEANHRAELNRLRMELDEICLDIKKLSPPSDNPIVVLPKSNFFGIAINSAVQAKARLLKIREWI